MYGKRFCAWLNDKLSRVAPPPFLGVSFVVRAMAQSQVAEDCLCTLQIPAFCVVGTKCHCSHGERAAA